MTRHPWRQETTPIGAEARSRVLTARGATLMGGVDYESWSRTIYSRLDTCGHLLLSVSEFRWKPREHPDYFADAPFSLYKVPYCKRAAISRLEKPHGLSYALAEAWAEEAFQALNAPCPVTRWKAWKFYKRNEQHGMALTYVYAANAQRWALYAEHKLRGISPILDGYYRSWRKYDRARLRAEHLKLAVEEIQ